MKRWGRRRKTKLDHLDNLINVETNEYARCRADADKYSKKLEGLDHWLHICARLEDALRTWHETGLLNSEAQFLSGGGPSEDGPQPREQSVFAVSAVSLDSMINDSNYFQHVLGARFHMVALFTRYTSLLMEVRKQALTLRNMVIVHFQNSIIYRNHERDLRQNLMHKGGLWNPLHEDISTLGPSDLVARSELLQLSRMKTILNSSMVQHNDLKKVVDSRIFVASMDH